VAWKVDHEGVRRMTPKGLEARRVHKIEKLIRIAGFPIPEATVAEIDYRDGRGLNPVRMKRYAAHDWRADPPTC
jgi:hypothetical protein